MSLWTHALCDTCYEQREPGREPTRLTEPFVQVETCCFCGDETTSGIYYRLDPNKAPCHGIGGYHEAKVTA